MNPCNDSYLRMKPSSVTIISFGNLGKDLSEKLTRAVSEEYDCNVHMKEVHPDLSDFYDAGRRQYHGDKLLKEVEAMMTNGSGKTIGLFTVDLFIPILTFIFGQAQLGGRAAVASLYRLRNECYGLPPDEAVMHNRLIKEVIHELGHTCGLIHCFVSDCVMRSSTYVEDIDQKGTQLCSGCRSLLSQM